MMEPGVWISGVMRLIMTEDTVTIDHFQIHVRDVAVNERQLGVGVMISANSMATAATIMIRSVCRERKGLRLCRQLR